MISVTCPGFGRAMCWLKSTKILLTDKSSSFFSVVNAVYLSLYNGTLLITLSSLFFHRSLYLSKAIFSVCSANSSFSFNLVFADSPTHFSPCLPPYLLHHLISPIYVAELISSYGFNCRLYKDDWHLPTNADTSWTRDLLYQLALGHCPLDSRPAFPSNLSTLAQ